MQYKNITLFLCLVIIIICINGCGPFCGNNKCESGENSTNCCSDCGCDAGFYCTNNTCVSHCGDNICTGDENISCCKDCGIEELKKYPYELKLAFMKSKFSDDCVIQQDEKDILNYSLSLFQYNSLVDVKNKILEMNGLSALLETLYYYNPYAASDEKDTLFNKIFENYPALKEEEKIYIIGLAHILLVDRKNILSWSIKDYNKENIYYLIERENNTQWGLGSISKEWIKLFPVSINFIEYSNKEKIIENIVEWEMKNFFHAYDDYGWEVYNRKSDETIYVPLKNIFRERVIDCHLASHILIGILRSINIPAYEKNFKGHGVTFIPDLNLYVHGDYIANFAVNPSLLMTKEELESYTNSERGYLKFVDESPYRFIELKRNGNMLYISGTISNEADSNLVKDSLKEYNIILEKRGIDWFSIKSDKLKIKELDDFYKH